MTATTLPTVTPFLQGFAVSFGLIAAIGAQNAHVLRMGLLRQHVVSIVALCIVSDCLLIALGVAGAAWIFNSFPGFMALATWGGALFLLVYGGQALLRAWKGGASMPDNTKPIALGAAVGMTLALTYLNPHVYLDTVVLVGSLSAAQGEARWIFGIGAMLASATWFVALAYGARRLAPYFKRPQAWRVLDTLVGIIMLSLAAGLAATALRAG
jgi:L-lysine exporter family protein LysE/ArgO